MTEPSAVNPLSTDPALNLEAGRLLFARPINFMLGVTKLADLPRPTHAEIAFAGRSNVGKSSLINALTGRKALARTSNAPGRTRELNFFDVDDILRLVDLPGFGYAKAPKTIVERWTTLTKDYLRGRANLARVFLLIDGRRGIGDNDLGVMDALDEAAVSYQVVITKLDKLKVAERDKILDTVNAALLKRPAAFPRIVGTSSEKRWGIDALRAEIALIATERGTLPPPLNASLSQEDKPA